MKLAWSKYNTNQLAVVPMNSSKVILLDQRQPSQVVSEFCNQQDPSQITSICWHPKGENRLCTVSQSGKVLIYDVEENKQEQQPKLSYDGGREIVNCAWGSASNNWIGVAYDS